MILNIKDPMRWRQDQMKVMTSIAMYLLFHRALHTRLALIKFF